MNTEDTIQSYLEQDKVRGRDWEGVGVIDARPVVRANPWGRDDGDDRRPAAPWTAWQISFALALVVTGAALGYAWYLILN